MAVTRLVVTSLAVSAIVVIAAARPLAQIRRVEMTVAGMG